MALIAWKLDLKLHMQSVPIVRLTSINVQKFFIKNPVFKSLFFFLDVY